MVLYDTCTKYSRLKIGAYLKYSQEIVSSIVLTCFNGEYDDVSLGSKCILFQPFIPIFLFLTALWLSFAPNLAELPRLSSFPKWRQPPRNPCDA